MFGGILDAWNVIGHERLQLGRLGRLGQLGMFEMFGWLECLKVWNVLTSWNVLKVGKDR